MSSITNRSKVLVIDKLEHWRKLSHSTLKMAGFKVRVLDNYSCPLSPEFNNTSVDLIILGCACIGAEELKFIARVRLNQLRLLVLCTFLRLRVMRLLFLQGVDDVAEKPFNPKQLLEVVDHSIQNIAARSARLHL